MIRNATLSPARTRLTVELTNIAEWEMNRFEKEVIKAPEGNIVSGLDNHPR
jgi:hypothetical protein